MEAAVREVHESDVAAGERAERLEGADELPLDVGSGPETRDQRGGERRTGDQTRLSRIRRGPFGSSCRSHDSNPPIQGVRSGRQRRCAAPRAAATADRAAGGARSRRGRRRPGRARPAPTPSRPGVTGTSVAPSRSGRSTLEAGRPSPALSATDERVLAVGPEVRGRHARRRRRARTRRRAGPGGGAGGREPAHERAQLAVHRPTGRPGTRPGSHGSWPPAIPISSP